MRSFAIIVLAIFLSATSVVAQPSTGTLHGRITDPSGAVIPKGNRDRNFGGREIRGNGHEQSGSI